MGTRHGRPELRLEVGGLGTIDPFRLKVVEEPRGSGEYFVEQPGGAGGRVALAVAGLNLVGAGHALLGLSMHWLIAAGGVHASPEPPPLPLGEVRLVVRRREARLLGSLLRRHLRRLPEAPPWMADLSRSFLEIEEVLRWEDGA
jgi:hypothetical protein